MSQDATDYTRAEAALELRLMAREPAIDREIREALDGSHGPLAHLAARIVTAMPGGESLRKAWWRNGKAVDLAGEILGIVADNLDSDSTDLDVATAIWQADSGDPEAVVCAIAEHVRSWRSPADPIDDDCPSTAEIMREEVNEALGREP
jgi:hypothetical protein